MCFLSFLYDQALFFAVQNRMPSVMLREYGAQEILQMERGILRVDPNTFDCDAYRFYAGDSEAVNAYRGEYMTDYSWAELTAGKLHFRNADARQLLH